MTAWPNLFEVRKYKSGWTIRVGRVLLRWTSQDAYMGLSAEWIGARFAQVDARRASEPRG